MLALRVRNLYRLAWLVFILGLLLISYLFSMEKALASDDSRVVSYPLNGGFVIDTPTFNLNSEEPTKVDAVQFSINGNYKGVDLDVSLSSDGVWYDCQLSHLGDTTRVYCSTKGGAQLTVAEMDKFSVRVVH